jgi:hypothetical protein
VDNLIYTLLAALATTIGANANIIAAGATAGVGRIRPVDETDLPFIGVFYLGDESIGEFGPQNTSFMDWNVNVGIDIALDADATVDGDEFQRLSLNMRADVHEALMTVAPTQGLTFVSFTAPLGANEPVTDDVGKRKTVSYRSNWLFRVRTDLTDMTTN